MHESLWRSSCGPLPVHRICIYLYIYDVPKTYVNVEIVRMKSERVYLCQHNYTKTILCKWLVVDPWYSSRLELRLTHILRLIFIIMIIVIVISVIYISACRNLQVKYLNCVPDSARRIRLTKHHHIYIYMSNIQGILKINPTFKRIVSKTRRHRLLALEIWSPILSGSLSSRPAIIGLAFVVDEKRWALNVLDKLRIYAYSRCIRQKPHLSGTFMEWVV